MELYVPSRHDMKCPNAGVSVGISASDADGDGELLVLNFEEGPGTWRTTNLLSVVSKAGPKITTLHHRSPPSPPSTGLITSEDIDFHRVQLFFFKGLHEELFYFPDEASPLETPFIEIFIFALARMHRWHFLRSTVDPLYEAQLALCPIIQLC